MSPRHRNEPRKHHYAPRFLIPRFTESEPDELGPKGRPPLAPRYGALSKWARAHELPARPLVVYARDEQTEHNEEEVATTGGCGARLRVAPSGT